MNLIFEDSSSGIRHNNNVGLNIRRPAIQRQYFKGIEGIQDELYNFIYL